MKDTKKPVIGKEAPIKANGKKVVRLAAVKPKTKKG